MMKKMNKVNLVIISLLLISPIYIMGCIENPANYQEHVIKIHSRLSKYDLTDCTCYKCTLSSGGLGIADKFIVNSLGTGYCWIDKGESCSRIKLATFINQDPEFNFLKNVGFGVGTGYISFGEANYYSGNNLDYVPRFVYSYDLPPTFEKETFEFSDTEEGDAIDDLMDDGKIPLFFMVNDYPLKMTSKLYEGERAQEIIEETFEKEKKFYHEYLDALDLDKHPAAILVPNLRFSKAEVGKIVDLSKYIESLSLEGSGVFSHDAPINLAFMPCQTNAIVNFSDINVIDSSECSSVTDKKEYVDCIINSSPDNLTINPFKNDSLFEILDELNATDNQFFNESLSYVVNLLFINKEDYGCDFNYAMQSAIYRSLYLLRRYQKPSFLVISLSKNCVNQPSDIFTFDEKLLANLDFARKAGIVGIIIPSYGKLSSSNSMSRIEDYYLPVSRTNSQICLDSKMILEQNVALPHEEIYYFSHDNVAKKYLFKALNLYYKNYLMPVIFDTDGINVTGVCDYGGRPDISFISPASLNDTKIICKKAEDSSFAAIYSLGKPKTSFFAGEKNIFDVNPNNQDRVNPYEAACFNSEYELSLLQKDDLIAGLTVYADPVFIYMLKQHGFNFDPAIYSKVVAEVQRSKLYGLEDYADHSAMLLFFYMLYSQHQDVYYKVLKKEYTACGESITSAYALGKLCYCEDGTPSLDPVLCDNVMDYLNLIDACDIKIPKSDPNGDICDKQT